MYDYLILPEPIKCKKCGYEIKLIQTKRFARLLKEYELGDLTNKYIISAIFEEHWSCDECDEIVNIYIIIYKGIIIGIVDNKEKAVNLLDNFNINDLIELYYQLIFKKSKISYRFNQLIKSIEQLIRFSKLSNAEQTKIINDKNNYEFYLIKNYIDKKFNIITTLTKIINQI